MMLRMVVRPHRALIAAVALACVGACANVDSLQTGYLPDVTRDVARDAGELGGIPDTPTDGRAADAVPTDDVEIDVEVDATGREDAESDPTSDLAPPDADASVDADAPPSTGGVCEPCASDGDCGDAFDLCLPYDDGLACGQDCSRPGDTCPAGTGCRAITDGGVIVARQCQPIDGTCEPPCEDDDDDGVCNDDDICVGGDDTADADGDGIPDACDADSGLEVCTNGIDDDADGAADCDDSDCNEHPACAPLPDELCNNDVDDDVDGAIDCADPDCVGSPACARAEICNNGTDDDFDELVDCDDEDCATSPLCARPEICDNERDDDLDGRTDCDDTDCAGSVHCPSAEICNNGTDDDFDGRIDCDDEDCATNPLCARPEICDNDRDDDLDGRVDCDDTDCVFSVACPSPEVCNDGRDNDFDGRMDCDDDDCASSPLCARPEICDNDVDDDLDGRTDCDDTDCASSPSCPSAEICNDGRDNDFDGRTDCDDSDCASSPLCARPEICDNRVDDDLDGRTDCDDSDCASSPSCPSAEICNDGRDNDFDGRTDCDDTDCIGSPLCASPEDCDNGVDDDLDGRTDCDDTDCSGDAACARGPGDACGDPFSISTYGVFDGSTAAMTADYGGSCTSAGGRDVVYAFRAPESGTVCAHTNGSVYDTVLYAETTCGDSGSTLDCDDDGGLGLQSQIEFEASSGTTYFLVVDGFGASSSGDYTLTVRAGPCSVSDGESCEDTYSTGFGTTSGTTAGRVHNYRGSCSLNRAPDVVYDFTAPSNGAVCIDTFGSSYDTTLIVQERCGDPTTDVGCNDDTSGLQSQVEIGGIVGQSYSIIVDGFSTSSGSYTLNVRDGTCDQSQGDTCSGVPIRGQGTWDGSTAGLAADYAAGCRSAGGPDRVYFWRAGHTGTVCMDTNGSTYDTVLHVQTSCGDAGSEVACDDDGGDGLQSQVEFSVTEGTFYHVIVDGFSSSSSGDFVLNIREGGC